MKDPPSGIRDDVGEAALKALGAAMNPNERRALQALYASSERLKSVLDRDRETFLDALRALRADAFQEEPVGLLYQSFLRGITEPMLVAELDIDPAALRKPLGEVLLASSSQLVRSRVAQLRDGLARRDFIPVFQAIVEELLDAEIRTPHPLEYTEFTLASGPSVVPPPPRVEPPRRTPRDATREAPWENSLGMKFVPVPGTGVLFSVWETRVQDFEAFVRETGHDATAGMYSLDTDGWKQRGHSWKDPGFAQTKVHPVVGVSWEDAQAFCRWLSSKEGRTYRLPSDVEWSTAVGLSPETGATPKDRDEKIADVYPWGTGFPPPGNAGNYAGPEARDTNWPAGFGTIDGFADPYSRTAPVGSFRANRHGLFDLGGNVWEWCEDFYDGQSGSRVLRGGSWVNDVPRGLLSSDRDRDAPDTRSGRVGFRVVLVVESRKAVRCNRRDVPWESLLRRQSQEASLTPSTSPCARGEKTRRAPWQVGRQTERHGDPSAGVTRLSQASGARQRVAQA